MRTKTLAVTALVVFLTTSIASAQPAPVAKPGAPPPTAPTPPAAKPGATPAPPTAQNVPPPPPPPAGPPPLSETLSGDAKADYDSAKLLFTDGDNAGALVKFKSAYDKSKDARLLWNMAACEKNLRHYSKALALVKQYLKEGEGVLTDQDKSEAQELIKVMEPFTAKLRLNVNQPGAEVTIDDEPAGKTPIDPVVVDIGTRRIRVHKDEFEDVVKEVPIGGAAEVQLDVALVPIVHEGRLTVHAPADAAIAIDGQVVGSGTWSGTLGSGGHTLRVSASKMVTYQTEVYLQDKEQRDVPVTLQAEPSKGLPLWVWIAGGAAVATGLGVGGYLLLKPSDTYDGPQGNLSPGVVQASRPVRVR